MLSGFLIVLFGMVRMIFPFNQILFIVINTLMHTFLTIQYVKTLF